MNLDTLYFSERMEEKRGKRNYLFAFGGFCLYELVCLNITLFCLKCTRKDVKPQMSAMFAQTSNHLRSKICKSLLLCTNSFYVASNNQVEYMISKMYYISHNEIIMPERIMSL